MSDTCVRVAARIRPLLPKELLHNHRVCAQAAPDNKQVIVGTDQLFPFDYVFGPTVSQTEVYESCVQPLVRSLLDGYNATVFCYGQTGSGKTYTLGGKNLEEEGGIIDRVAHDVFALLEERRQSRENLEVGVRVSYLELYMEELRDLLQLNCNPKELHIRDDERGNTVVVGAKEMAVVSAEELLSIVKEGNALRHTGTTGMNERSSRSHAFLIIQLSQRCRPNKSVPNRVGLSKLCLVDLAGSERAGKTGNTGARFKESVFINTDLLALCKVIRALADSAQHGRLNSGSSTHIPYRDSKVTRLLRDSLGGTAHTLMITCVSPSHDNIAETLCALQFATRARHVRNRLGEMYSNSEVTICPSTWNPGKSRVQELEEEIYTLKELLKEKDGDVAIQRVRTGSVDGWEDGSRRTMADSDKRESQENTQLWFLVEEAADLLKLISSAVSSSSVKQQLDEWQERHNALNHPHQLYNHTTENSGPTHHVTILQLRRELNKCQEALDKERQVVRAKNEELKTVQSEIDKRQRHCEAHLLALEEERERTRVQTEQLVDQQIVIDRLHGDLLRFRAETPGKSIRRPLSVPLRRHIYGQIPAREVQSCPPAYSLERVMAAFRMHNQLLLAKTEERDEVYSPFTEQLEESKDKVDVKGGKVKEVEEGDSSFRRSLNTTWTRRQRKPTLAYRNTEPDQTSDGVLFKENGHDSSWLELEEEHVLQRRAELLELEEELRRREEVLQQREAYLQQKNDLEVKKCSSSQALSLDLLRMSSRLETLDEQLEMNSVASRREGVTTEELERERDAVRQRRDALDAQLKDNRVLTAEEEHSLLELDEAVNILDVAVQFKNRSIQDKQQRLSIKDSLLRSSEPAQLSNVTKKLKELSTHEASELLIRYFNKVICLREAKNTLELRCDELELRGGEQEAELEEMEASLQRLAQAADRRLTQQQQDHQSSIQQLLHKLRASGSGEAQQELQERLQHLEKEVLFYKTSSRNLRKKLRELQGDTSHAASEDELAQPDTHLSHTKNVHKLIQVMKPPANSRSTMSNTHSATKRMDADNVDNKVHATQVKANRTVNSSTSSSSETTNGRRQSYGSNERISGDSGEDQMRRVCLSRKELRQVFPTKLQVSASASGSRRSAVDGSERMAEDSIEAAKTNDS